MSQYFYVLYDSVLQGPQELPTNLVDVPDFIKNTSGWYEFVDTGVPDYTPIQQQPVFVQYTLIDNKVYPQWIVIDILEEDQPKLLESLAKNKQVNISIINSTIGTLRAKYLTTIAGQDLTYQQKMFEVQRYDVDTNPTGSNYPFLQAEATATNSTLQSVYTSVKNAVSNWSTIGAQLEGMRRGAIVAVENAADMRQLDKVVAEFNNQVKNL